MRGFIGLIAALAAALPEAQASAAPALRLERVVVVLRHGVRPPTKAAPVPAGLAADPWPAWPVPFGHLTPHGADAVRGQARQDARAYVARGLLPAHGCPPKGVVDLYADSDQRTIATAEALAEGLAPGCGLVAAHKPQGEDDPVFSPIGSGGVDYDADRARAAVLARFPGGPQPLADAHKDDLERLQAILAPACAAPACALAAMPTTLAPPKAGARPRMEGALDLASTAAQVLLLEYAEGKPMAEVGWGRTTAQDVARLSAFHALEFDVLARTPYVARRNVALIAPRIARALAASGPGPRLTLLVGHDTNVASLAGVLDVHWAVEGYAPDDPAPGGALGFERLRDARGRRFVRVFYAAQTLEQLRAGAPAAARRTYLRVPACGGDLCTPAQMERLLSAR